MSDCTSDLVNSLAAVDLGSVADDLKGHRVLAQHVYDGLQLGNKTPKEKARDIVSNIHAKVVADPEPVFAEFLKVLRRHEGLGTLLKTLEVKYRKFDFKTILLTVIM